MLYETNKNSFSCWFPACFKFYTGAISLLWLFVQINRPDLLYHTVLIVEVRCLTVAKQNMNR